jgi:molybdenum-dependent DNA-binding transcriptional regulator ModE
VTSPLYRTPTGAGRGGPGTLRDAAAVAGRVEDFAELLGQGYSLLYAAERIGVSYRTAARYINRLRAQQGTA